MTPSEAASRIREASATAPQGKIGIVTKPGQATYDSFWYKFWNNLYSNPVASTAADKIIKAGNKVDAFNTNVTTTVKETAKAAKTGVGFLFQWGPILLILGLILYVLGPGFLARRS